MNYEIKVIYGVNTDVINIENVVHLALEGDVYFLYNEANEVLFTSPKEFVVYINKK